MNSEPRAPRPITPIGILGVGLALLLLAGAALGPLKPGDRDLQDSSSLQRAFLIGALPSGWAQATARELKDGRQVFLFQDPNAAEPAPLPADPGAEPKPEKKERKGFWSMFSRRKRGGGGGGGDLDKQRWSRLVVGPEGQPPRRMALVRLPYKKAERELKTLFQGLAYKDLEQIGEQGGDLPMDSGRLDWAGYEAPFVRVRHLYTESQKPTFHETIRVNLTLGREAWIALFAWDPRLPGDLPWVEEALGKIQPQPSPADLD